MVTTFFPDYHSIVSLEWYQSGLLTFKEKDKCTTLAKTLAAPSGF